MNVFPPARILVPHDLTERSAAAWRYALALAQRTGAAVEAVHVASPKSKKAAAKRLTDALGQVKGRIVYGDPTIGILRAAQAAKAQLLVMGTAGTAGLARLKHLSETETVVRSSPVPVLSVHGAAELPGEVLAPVNSEAYSLEGFYFAEQVAFALGAKLTLFHSAPTPAAAVRARRELKKSVERLGLRVPVAVKVGAGEPVAAILAAAKKAGLIVLVAHRKGLFHDAVLGTTAEQVLRLSPVPVLSVPPSSAFDGA